MFLFLFKLLIFICGFSLKTFLLDEGLKGTVVNYNLCIEGPLKLRVQSL